MMPGIKRVLLVAMLLLAAATGLTNATSATPPRWVTGWEAPPVGSFPRGFTDQTLRLIVTPHASGSEARVVISNQFGRTPLTLSDATIARQAGGASIDARTLMPLNFDGKRAVTIPAGQQVLSDPAAITTAPFQNLAVSLAFTQPTGAPTYHFDGLQTSYVSPVGTGDLTGALDGGAFTASTPMRFFLSGVQVLAPAPWKTIVVVGDSITDGVGAADQNTRWPDVLQRRLLAAGSHLSVANAGISANQITQSAPPADPQGGPLLEQRFHGDVLSQPNLAGIILSEGINDIIGSHATASQIIAGLAGIAGQAHAAGVPIIVGTLTPMQGFVDDSPTAQATLHAVNNWIRTQTVFNGVVDFAEAVQDPTDPRRLLPAYDSGDHLHPSARGFAAMARAVNLQSARRVFGDLPGVAPPPK